MTEEERRELYNDGEGIPYPPVIKPLVKAMIRTRRSLGVTDPDQRRLIAKRAWTLRQNDQRGALRCILFPVTETVAYAVSASNRAAGLKQ